MKNLILVRHAKSSWNFPVDDFDRVLEDNGVSDAVVVSSFFVKDLPKTYSIIASASKRTYQTALIFAKQFDYPKEKIIFTNKLYTFDENTLEKFVRDLAENDDTIILFAHNAAITNFVSKFGNLYIDNVPTSGLVWLRFSSQTWYTINTAETIKKIFPKDLKKIK